MEFEREEPYDDDDSGRESSDDDEDLEDGDSEDDGLNAALIDNPSDVANLSTSRDRMDFEEFPYEVLTTEQIMQHMSDCIREVNSVVQLPPTITRILLNHFKWDKEKLYERYYDGDTRELFNEAHIIDPTDYNQQIKVKASTTGFLFCPIYFLKSDYSKPFHFQRSSYHNSIETCLICCRDIPSSVSYLMHFYGLIFLIVL